MSKIGNVLYNHILKNKREYLVITILFFIGIILGVFLINSSNDEQIEEVNNYLNNLISNIKLYDNINLFALLKKSIIYNLSILIILWLAVTTIAGIPTVYGIILIKGFSIGYTISSLITCFGIGNGLLIIFSLLVLHNIIFLPSIFSIGVRRNKFI